jgi:predicted metal-binding membrane protein
MSSMESASNLEMILKRDRWFVLAALAGVTALAWAYLVVMATDMDDMALGAIAMPTVEPWSALDFWLMFVMWAVMMVGMMLPSAAPMILLYATVSRRQRGRGHVFAPTGVFAAGYLVAWTTFSLAATALQWAFEQAALLSPMMVSTSPYLGGALLAATGIYQWTPLKHACLQNCRAPAEFLSRSWRNGTGGAVAMGVHHGAYCVGCCWVFMGLLFVAGVMNLLWVAAITALVLIEKIAPGGHRFARIAGALFVAAGAYMMIHS